MSGKVATWAWDLKLSPAEKLVLLKLADNAHEDGGSARPGVPYLARRTNLSERTVQRCLRELETQGLIEAVADMKGGRSKVVEYRLAVPWAEEDAPRKGDILSPLPKLKGDNLSPLPKLKGDIQRAERVTSDAGPSSYEPKTEPKAKELNTSPPASQDGQGGIDQIVTSGEDVLSLRETSLTLLSPTAYLDDGFGAFWAAYPKDHWGKKVGKGDARAVWGRLSTAERFLASAAVGHYRAACDAGRYAKAPAVWLRAKEDWASPTAEWQTPPATPSPAPQRSSNGHTPFHCPPESEYAEREIR
jgi:hypothetical protein